MDLASKIREIPDYPKPGILFYDMHSLMKEPGAIAEVIERFAEKFAPGGIDAVAGIESRGFVFGAPLAVKLGCPFIPIRKPGKLPGETISIEYSLEYGTDKIQMQKDSLSAGMKTLIVDDLLATGGTMVAACKLVETLGAKVAGIAFVVELDFLKGREKLEGYETLSLVHYHSE